MKTSYKKIIAIFKYLGIQLDNPKKSFSSRFKIQKISYLSKALGIDLYHKFTIRIKGPYSHILAQDYFNYPEAIVKYETDYILTENEKRIINEIKEKVLEHYITEEYEAEFLEAVSTKVYLKKENPDLFDDDLFAEVKIKPYLKEWMIIIANNVAKELLFKPEYLTDELKKEFEMWDKID